MYSEDDFIQLSALQHFVFCERQWALIHLEQMWMENRLTMEGHIFHERVDSQLQEMKKGSRICRSIRLRSLVHGITGIADVVEFKNNKQTALPLPYPIEYKRGKIKQELSDSIQLCAQALCLEEMLKTTIPEGALFYGKTKRRHVVQFDAMLRHKTISCIEKIHFFLKNKKNPRAQYTKKCDSCSLFSACMPHYMINSNQVKRYLHQTQKWIREDFE